VLAWFCEFLQLVLCCGFSLSLICDVVDYARTVIVNAACLLLFLTLSHIGNS